MRLILMAPALLAACNQVSAPPNNSAAIEPSAANESANTGSSVETPVVPAVGAGSCRMQDGKEIAANQLKAIGTEPFWGAAIDGRCVTYTTPENQRGTRIWTAFSGTRDAGRWEGSLGKEIFVLVTRPEPGCSDGMSDRSFPIAVTLTIGAEERRGCAE